jgi:hypothetical protein
MSQDVGEAPPGAVAGGALVEVFAPVVLDFDVNAVKEGDTVTVLFCVEWGFSSIGQLRASTTREAS